MHKTRPEKKLKKISLDTEEHIDLDHIYEKSGLHSQECHIDFSQFDMDIIPSKNSYVDIQQK